MYRELRYANADKTMIHAEHEDGRIVVVEPMLGEFWNVCKSGRLGTVKAFKKPPEPTAAEKTARKRAGMSCTMAQLGLALIDAGQLEAFEAALDARGKIIWEKSQKTKRRGPILDALKAIMSDKKVDDLFAAAAEIEI